MLVFHQKLLPRSRTGDTKVASCPTALHGCATLMVTDEVNKATANMLASSTMLATGKPNGKYRPLTIGTVSRRLVSCTLRNIALPGTCTYLAPHRIANGVQRLCGSTVQIAHILRTTSPSQTHPHLPDFEKQKCSWIHKLRPEVPALLKRCMT